MADQTIPDYETISAAVTGETWAVEKVLMCYKDEIDRQATVKKRQPDGTFKLEIDEDMRQYITMKLRKASGRSKYPLIRRYPNGETHLSKPQVSIRQSITYGREPGELKHLSTPRRRKKPRFPK